MLVIITAVIGFLSSSFPNLLRFFEVRMRLKHEIQLATIKLEAAVRGADAEKEVAQAKAAVDDTISARNQDNNEEGSAFVVFLRSTLRPFVTLAFVFLYLGFKVLTIGILVRSGITLDNLEAASRIILDETTISILMIVIGFYFGSRSILNQSNGK